MTTQEAAEKWELVDFGPYTVSNMGRVRNTKTRKILKTALSRGYHKLVLRTWDKQKTNRSIHRLVAEAFIGKMPPKFEVNHIDCNKQNNHISNLEYVTRRQNHLHAMAHGRMVEGDNHPSSKLRSKDVLLILEALKTKRSHSNIGAEFGVTKQAIRNIHCGNNWKSLTDSAKQEQEK